VRKNGGSRVRIAGQLIDAETGMQLWADKFGNVHFGPTPPTTVKVPLAVRDAHAEPPTGCLRLRRI